MMRLETVTFTGDVGTTTAAGAIILNIGNGDTYITLLIDGEAYNVAGTSKRSDILSRDMIFVIGDVDSWNLLPTVELSVWLMELQLKLF